MISINYKKHTLSNGLDVILHEDHSIPFVAVNLWYHVGSKNEEGGRTGFAHLFEHIMFEGSKHHNKNYFEPLQRVGANINGSTTADRTNYWETLPSNYLEMALWLEADRMGFLLDALDQKRFDIQRDVVKNERRQRYENTPYGKASLLLQPAMFPPPHPYSWTVIGSMEDLDAASLDDVKNFFIRYYSPSTASLAIAGDINPDATRKMIERYFSDIPSGPAVERVHRMNSGLKGETVLILGDKVQLPRLSLVWPSLPMFDDGEAPLDTLATLLADGKSSRLHRILVYEKQIARDVIVGNYAQEIAGEFHIQVTANPGHSLGEIQEVVESELEQIRREGPSPQEIERAKNRIQSDRVRSLERLGGFGSRSDQLNHFNIFSGEPGRINTDNQRYERVTAEDVAKYARSILGDSRVKMSVFPEKLLVTGKPSVDRTVMPKEAGDHRTFSPPVPVRVSLKNGMQILHVEKHELPLITFGLVLPCGSVIDPPGRPGLNNISALMVAEGTRTRSSQQIAEEMEYIGSHLAINPGREHTIVLADVLINNWRKALEVLSDVVTNPVFPDKELARIRKERIIDLKRISDDPNLIAQRASRALVYGPDTIYGHPISGTEQSVASFTQTDVIQHYQANYRPAGATLIVVGDATIDEVVNSIEQLFGGWATGTSSSATARIEDAQPPQATTIFLANKPGAPQSVVRAGHTIMPRSHPDYYAFSLLNYVFGAQPTSRLFMNLRQDKGYTYGYYSSIEWVKERSILLAGGSVHTAVTKETVFETIKEYSDIRGRRPVTSAEFTDAREGIFRAFPSHFETHNQLFQQLTNLVVFGLPDDYYSGYLARLEGVTLDDVQKAGSKWIDDSHLATLVVGDTAVVEPRLQELGYPLVHVDYEGRPHG